jgi:hypothetical protein
MSYEKSDGFIVAMKARETWPSEGALVNAESRLKSRITWSGEERARKVDSRCEYTPSGWDEEVMENCLKLRSDGVEE